MTDIAEAAQAATPEAKMTAAERMAIARAARKGHPQTAATEAASQATTVPAGLTVSEDHLAARAEAQRLAAEEAALAMALEQNKPTNNARVAEKQAMQEDVRARAARQRADLGPAGAVPTVKVRVTKAGNAKVSMGIHVEGVADACYEWKEEPSFPKDVAEALEARGFVEIL
jgi:hypothetical protein